MSDQTTNPESSSPVNAAPAIREHKDQTPLERVIRANLWQPNYIIETAQKKITQCVKDADFLEAHEWQGKLYAAKSEKARWEHVLELYENEFQSVKNKTKK